MVNRVVLQASQTQKCKGDDLCSEVNPLIMAIETY